MIARLLAGIALVVTVASAAVEPRLAAADDPVTLSDMLARAATYVSRFEREFTSVVAEERYLQQASGRETTTGSGRGATPTLTGWQRRELVSDFLLVKPAGLDGWVPFRDVFEVDGRPVREREERLQTLLIKPTAKNLELAQAIIAESARYNIGDVQRTINMPLLALGFLSATQQSRFRFTFGKDDPAVGSGVRIVNYEEHTKPTLVRSPDGRNLFASGRLWIVSDTGRIMRTEMVFQDAALRAVITTSFHADERFSIDVPAEMIEEYAVRRYRVSGRATYARFRRFGVQAVEDIPLPTID